MKWIALKLHSALKSCLDFTARQQEERFHQQPEADPEAQC